jgi:nucleoside-diphosphate-sugar epimerase
VYDLFWFGDHLPPESASFSKYHRDAKKLVAADLRGYDVVIFLAGMSNDPMANFDPLSNFTENAAVPTYIAHICGEAEVPRLIHGGSSSVYGRRLRTDGPATEDSGVMGNSPYGLSKYMAEIGCESASQYGVEVINFRMGTVSGYSPRMRFDLLINRMVKDAIVSGTISIFDGSTQRPILDMRDLVVAYELAAMTSKLSGVFNLHSSNVDIRQVASVVQKAVSAHTGRSIKLIDMGIPDVRSYTCSSTKASAMFGFHPCHSDVDTALHVIGGWDKIPDPLDRKHYNIEVFKALRDVQPLPAE